MRVAIDFQTAEPQRPVSGCAARAPAQYRAQPGQQFARLERFGQVIVGADLQAHDPIGRISASGQHQHRRVGFRAQLAADIQTIHVGQRQIQHDGRVIGIRQLFERRGAVARDRNAESRLAEIFAQHLGKADIVFDQHYAFGHAPHFIR
jgi:hypothetical protein